MPYSDSSSPISRDLSRTGNAYRTFLGLLAEVLDRPTPRVRLRTYMRVAHSEGLDWRMLYEDALKLSKPRWPAPPADAVAPDAPDPVEP
jgi:hypothetical protein